MTTVTLLKWGNSVGVRIPSTLLDESQAKIGDRFEMSITQDKGFTLKPKIDPQSAWQAAFNAIAQDGDDALLIKGL